jgi:16S rRNA (guanine527-N7)-methyltransferase
MSGGARAVLERGANDLGLDLGETQIMQLLDYMSLIQKWNRVYNLTAVRDAAEMMTHHLLDSLAVVLPLRRQLAAMAAGAGDAVSHRLLDVGSGAGLPGVVLAITCPELQVECVDTVAKKATFIQQAAITLKLSNLRGVHARVESLTGPYGVVCSRAFASLKDFTSWSGQALDSHGVWMALKGKTPAEEQAELGANIEVFHVEPLQVPGLDADRCIVWMRKTP